MDGMGWGYGQVATTSVKIEHICYISKNISPDVGLVSLSYHFKVIFICFQKTASHQGYIVYIMGDKTSSFVMGLSK